MSTYDRLASLFHARIDLIAAGVDALAPGLETAAMQVVDAVLNDRRILVCATGDDAALAHYMAQTLRRGDGGLPSIPALALGSASGSDDRDTLRRDIRALSRDGDVLLCIDTTTGASSGRFLVELAAQRNLSPVLLSEAEGAPQAVLQLPLGADDQALRRELALMALHCLHKLVNELLMGEQ